MLYLIGAGLWDEKDMTLRALEAMKKCDVLYLEGYTSVWNGKGGLEKLSGKRIKLLERKDLEEGSGKIVRECEKSDVGIVVPGDPMVATTHSSLVMEAKKKGVTVEVIHAPSIVSAIAETGLHIYKFGRTASVPFSSENFFPESFYDVLKENKTLGLHTLLLLDIRDGRQMEPGEALRALMEIEGRRKGGVIGKADKAIVFSFRGKASVFYGNIQDLMKPSFLQPCCIIIPGKLHSTEGEFLSLMQKLSV